MALNRQFVQLAASNATKYGLQRLTDFPGAVTTHPTSTPTPWRTASTRACSP